MTKKIRDMLVLLLVILEPLLSIFHFLQLPADIYLPIHWNISGSPDFWVDKELFLYVIIFFIILQILFYVFYCFARYLFRNCKSNLSATRNVTVTMMLFCFCLQELFFLNTLWGRNIDMARAATIGLGVFFIVIGNVMPTLKPNYWVGIRIKWTMEDPEIWSIVHRSASKLWGIGGGILIICSFLFPIAYLGTMVLFSVFLLCLISCIQAWRLAKRKQQE